MSPKQRASKLYCENLSAGYGPREVISSISASFYAGQLTCILGANGAGKTTLLRALSGYIPAREGHVYYNEHNLTQIPPRQRARYIAFVPQVVLADVPMTVLDFVSLARYPFALSRFKLSTDDCEIITRVLALTGLIAFIERRCSDLSGGEWRRVLIAQGLAQQTPILLLDEPTAFLDPPARHELLSMLKHQAHSAGTAVIAVLQDPALAAQHADAVLLLKKGQVLATGETETALAEWNLKKLYDGAILWLTPEEVKNEIR